MTAATALPLFQPPGSPEPVNGTAPRAEIPVGEIRAVEMEITPEMAGEWLDQHRTVVAANRAAGGGKARDNRPIRWEDVDGYARDMKAGNWARNGETIKRASDGTIPDGQQRLWACRKAKTSFMSLVVFGVAPEAQDTIDTGIKRKLSDQLAIGNEKNAVVLAAVARWSLRWLHGVRGGTSAAGKYNPTQSEMLEYIALTPRLRDAATFAVHARQSFKSVRASVYGIAWMVLTGIDAIEATVFFDRIIDGVGLPAGSPVLAFRQRIWNSVENSERLSELEQLALLFIAWNHFRAGTKISRMQLPAGGLTPKNFPEPK